MFTIKSKHILLQYFNNEKFEAERYDQSLKKYEAASLKTNTSLAMLNFGQNAIFSTALSLIMILTTKNIMNGNINLLVFLYAFTYCILLSYLI